MMLFVLLLILPGAMQMSTTDEYNVTDSTNTTDYPYDFTDYSTEETEQTQGISLTQFQNSSKLRVYKGPLPKFPGTTSSPWIALHSPVRMYIPIRNTGIDYAESEHCVQCPKNIIVLLPPHQKQILTPIPTISICSSFARRTGRVHVAVVSGPRPGQRLSVGRYQVELMVWKAEGPVHSCTYNITIKGKRQVPANTRKIPCPKPEKPTNGLVLCDPSGRKYYPHNSVCQVFCMTSYLVENSTSNSSTIVCKNGRWSPEGHVSCVAAFCSELPKPPTHGSWNCDKKNFKTNFRNGTYCKVNCEPDYVIPSSQLEKSIIVCRPPSWNHSNTLRECKRAQLPKLLNCHNRHHIVRIGHTVEISLQLLPKGTNHAGAVLTPTCSLQGKHLSKGKHQNVCEVTDPELRTKRKCSYRILIEESSGPQPHAGDCKNRTVFANRKGIIHSKSARFVVKIGEPARTRILQGNCKPKGNLRVGTHNIVCKATDKHTKVVGSCSYWLKVQEKLCPPPQEIPNGRVVCNSYAVGAVCHYECYAGYAMPIHHLSRATKSCHSNMKWQPILDPICKIERPELKEGCDNLEAELSSSENFTVPLPTYYSTGLNETVNVTCTPVSIDTAGDHPVWCAVEDERFNVSCNFNVTISMENELTTITEMSTTEVERPELMEGCDNLETQLSSSENFTVPLPTYYSTGLNETLNVTCTPASIHKAGYHQVWCAVVDERFNASCNFNVTISMENELTTITEISTAEVEELRLIEGCDNLEINMSSPFNYSVPLPQFVTANNESIDITCSPFYISDAGEYQVTCTGNEDFSDASCNFTALLRDEPTTIFSQENEPVELVKICEDMEVNVSYPINFLVPKPQFLTALNITLNASCTPSLITTVGRHEVICTVDDDIFDDSCQFNITVLLEDQLVTVKSPERKPCKPLSPPLHGSIQCSAHGEIHTESCQVSCDPGYGFSEDNYLLTVVCIDDLWDFQESDINRTLPDCFAQMEGSAVEVWISFEAFAPHCEEELEEQMKDLVSDLCQTGTDCSKVDINCTLDEESDMMLMIVNWTVKADFNDEEYYEGEEIPEAEIRLESVMERTRAFLATEDAPGGVHLFRDSFRRGLITLVCPNGFILNVLVSKCIQCPAEMEHCS